jgi:hypothetical protein
MPVASGRPLLAADESGLRPTASGMPATVTKEQGFQLDRKGSPGFRSSPGRLLWQSAGKRCPEDYLIDATHLAQHCQRVFLSLPFLGRGVLPSPVVGLSDGDWQKGSRKEGPQIAYSRTPEGSSSGFVTRGLAIF